ncbi:MAG: 2-hydroxychromene-2-carboxylate isomerase [Betaproteobacteria bacterium]|nr:2-hydroxychromene-2-carboxylate isomerase [Betaproteobacteria bacterium]
MAAAIDFYFDFSSPYGYFGAAEIDDLAQRHGRRVIWHPVLLGALYKSIGTGPNIGYPHKGEYFYRDAARTARFLGLPYRLPSHFPVATQVAARAFYVIADGAPDATPAKPQMRKERARDFALACLRAYFVDDIDIGEPARVLDIAAVLGEDRARLAAALEDPAVKQRLREANDAALARGVFGSPFFIVDDERFWGSDRLSQLERWLAEGGF